MARKNATVDIPASPLLVKSIRWLTFVGTAALFQTREIAALYFLIFVGFFLVGLIIHSIPKILSIAGKAQTLLSLVALGLAVFDFTSVSQSFLLTTAHFLILIQTIRLLSLQTTRENLGSLLLSSLMMISASTLSVDWVFLLILLIFIPSVIWALMVHNLSVEIETPMDEANPQVLAADVHLKRPTWINTLSSLRSAALGASLVTLVCCAIIFIIFPRFNFQGFRGQFLQPVAKTGMSKQVNLGQQSAIFQDNTIVMRIQLDSNDLNRWPGYVRGRTLSVFDGANWARSIIENDSAIYGVRGEFGIPNVPKQNTLHQRIYLESMDTSMLYAAERVFNIKIERPMLFTSPDGSLRRAANDTWRIYYEAQSAITDVFNAKPLSDKEREDNLMLGPLKGNRQINTYVATIVGREKSPEKIAQSIQKRLQNDFTYSLEGKKFSIGMNPVLDFLFHSKQGHCEYFASAMAVMLRSKGIPARIVTGFLSQEKNRRGNYIVVRSLHAHAWVEVYIDGQGWLRFDPTPPSRDDFLIQPSRFAAWSEMMDNLNLKWNRYVMSYDLDRQVDIFMAFNRRSQKVSFRFNWNKLHFSWKPNMAAPLRSTQDLSIVPFRSLGKIILVLFVVLIVAMPIYFYRRKRNMPEWIYRELMQIFTKTAATSSSRYTLRENFERCRCDLQDSIADLEYLIKAYYEFRFNPARVASLSDRQQIKEILEKIKI